MKLKLGSIDDDIEALVVPELKAEMIIGLRSLKQFQCSLDFHCDNLWTELQEGSFVPLNYEPLTISSSQPEVTQAVDEPQGLLSSPEPPDTNSAATGDAWQPRQSPTDSEESGHEHDEDHDVWATSENGSIDLQVQARRHLDEGIDKILELAATGVTGTERDRLADLVRSYRDVFALTDVELGRTNLLTHRIDTGDTGPIKIPPHRTSPAKLPIIRDEVKSMLEKGVIRPSKSLYRELVVLRGLSEVE